MYRVEIEIKLVKDELPPLDKRLLFYQDDWSTTGEACKIHGEIWVEYEQSANGLSKELNKFYAWSELPTLTGKHNDNKI